MSIDRLIMPAFLVVGVGSFVLFWPDHSRPLPPCLRSQCRTEIVATLLPNMDDSFQVLPLPQTTCICTEWGARPDAGAP